MEYFVIRASKTLLQKCDPFTNYRSGGAKSGEDVFFEKFDNHFIVISLCRHNFYPFRDIAHSNQDELVAEGIWEWSHEVDTLNIKNFNFKNRVPGHHVSS